MSAHEPIGPALPSRAECEAAEWSARLRTHRVPFPSSCAGAPMLPGTFSEAAASASTYGAYKASVDAAKTSNPYAPFTSQLDWKVARWAKMRGSGSTAFTELLEIEEVS